MRIVHPFHPLSGREFALVCERQSRHGARVWYEGADGAVASIPAAWTDLGAPDPFLEIGGGRAHFRPGDLVAVADLLAELRAAREPRDV